MGGTNVGPGRVKKFRGCFVPQKTSEDTRAGREPKTQLWIRIGAFIIAASFFFTVGFVVGYEKAQIDLANAIEDAIEDAFSDY